MGRHQLGAMTMIIAGCYWLDLVILGSLTFQIWSTYSAAGTSQGPVPFLISIATFPKLLRFSSSFSLCGSGGAPRERFPPLGDDPLSHWSPMLSGDVRAWKIVSSMRFWVRVLVLVVAFLGFLGSQPQTEAADVSQRLLTTHVLRVNFLKTDDTIRYS